MFSPEFFMKEALKEARKAFEKDEVPVGAVIVCKNQIIARAHNLTETLNDVTAHAEIQAITAASIFLGNKYLNECELYVTLEPCAMCAGAIFWSQLGSIVWGASDEKRGYSKFSSEIILSKTMIQKGIMKNECEMLIKEFFSLKRG